MPSTRTAYEWLVVTPFPLLTGGTRPCEGEGSAVQCTDSTKSLRSSVALFSALILFSFSVLAPRGVDADCTRPASTAELSVVNLASSRRIVPSCLPTTSSPGRPSPVITPHQHRGFSTAVAIVVYAACTQSIAHLPIRTRVDLHN